MKYLAVFFLILISLGSWTLASPIGSSPDDGFHMSSIWCSGNGYPGMCEKAENPRERYVAAVLLDSPSCYAFHSKVGAVCQIENGILGNTALSLTGTGNFAGGYPPSYYDFMHNFATSNAVSSVLVMRAVNVLIFALFAISLWVLAPKRTRAAQRFTWLVTLVPLGLFIIASINPSSWAVMGLGFSFLALYSLFIERQSRLKTLGLSILYVLSALMAAGARGDSAVYEVLASFLALFLTYKEWANRKLLLIIPLLVIAKSITLFLGSGHASVAASGFSGETRQINGLSLFIENLLRLPELFMGVFGSWPLGWFDTEITQTVWFLGLAIYVSVVGLTWQRMSRLESIANALTLFVIMAIPLYILQESRLVVGEQLQPRYLLPLVVVFIACCLLSFSNKELVGSRYWRLFIFLALSASQAAALYLNLARYTRGGVGGAGSASGFNLNDSGGWWWQIPIQPMSVLAIGTIAFTILTYVLLNPLQPALEQKTTGIWSPNIKTQR